MTWIDPDLMSSNCPSQDSFTPSSYFTSSPFFWKCSPTSRARQVTRLRKAEKLVLEKLAELKQLPVKPSGSENSGAKRLRVWHRFALVERMERTVVFNSKKTSS